jgi:hypothetical protein
MNSREAGSPETRNPGKRLAAAWMGKLLETNAASRLPVCSKEKESACSVTSVFVGLTSFGDPKHYNGPSGRIRPS